MHSVFSQMKGYGPLMALGIIALLSVCAAFFIYRSAKGQSKRNGEDSVTEHMEEDEKKRTAENKHTESTGTFLIIERVVLLCSFGHWCTACR